MAANQGCAGVDGESIALLDTYINIALAELTQALEESSYQPLPAKQIFIPKASGEWRELAVPTVRDRIIQQALLQILHPLVEPQFSDSSFAYCPGRSHHQAVAEVCRWGQQGYEWILDGDIVDYFGQVQHPRLKLEVQRFLPKDWTETAWQLIDAWLKAGILTPKGIVIPQKGLPQGAVISPLLANIYLDAFDTAVGNLGLKLVRYADDFVVLGRREEQIVQAQAEIAQLLTRMGLQLHPQKTQVTNFDKGFRFLGHVFTGELVLPIRKPQEIQLPRASQPLGYRLVHSSPAASEITAMQQALVAALKKSQKPIPPPLFVVLGYTIRPNQSVKISSQEHLWLSEMATIYLVEQGTSITKEQGRFRVQPPQGEVVEIPIREVERILIFGNSQLTTAVLCTCLEENIPVIFLSQLGEYKGQLWNAENRDMNIEKAQFQRQSDEFFRLQMARAVVQGKLFNSKLLLLRLNRKRRLESIQTAIVGISTDLEALENAQNVAEIMGYEGCGAARYFPALGQAITSEGFELRERVFHPPDNPMNAMLSFGYTQLLNNVFSLLLAEGVNPYLGNLHGTDKQRADLAFDLMEEFRSPIVDTLVMKLVNQKIIKPTDFSWYKENGGIYLINPARRVFLKYFEEKISELVSHPDIQTQVSYRRAIQLQIRRYKLFLVNDDFIYEPWLRRQ